MKTGANCPCGRGYKYEECCKPKHDSQMNALTAEDLMRSRYSAFTKAMGDYLSASHHQSTRRSESSKPMMKWAKSVKWDSLKVLEIVNGGEDDFDGIVEFKAFYFENRKRQVIHERSLFKKEFGVWYYLDKVETVH